MRLRGRIDGGGRLDVGRRWPGEYFSRTELIVAAGGRCTVEGRFQLSTGSRVLVADGGHLRLGSGFINSAAHLVCVSGITIGEDAAIGSYVLITDSDFHGISPSSRPRTQPITIGDHVWIGMRATILKGVTIGDGAIVAAGSVVTRDVEPDTLVAGSPAAFVRRATWQH